MFEKADVCVFVKGEILQGKSIEYFTGVQSDMALLLKTKRKQILYLSDLEEKPKGDFILKSYNVGQLLKDIKRTKAKTIGLHFGELTKSGFDRLKKEFKGYKLVDVGTEVMKLREIKNKNEVKHLKKAIAITETIIEDVVKKLPTFTYEIQAIQFIREQFIKHHVVASFPPIVASGKNSKNPHYHPKPTSKLNNGFCIIDMGVKYKGYCADITRTVYLGTPSKQELTFYNTIKDELYDLEKKITPGMSKFSTSFPMIHLIGHGIGLDVHETPWVGIKELKVGICVAIEPAQYNTKYGVRIEDDYHLTEKGLKRLSKTSRELLVLKRK